MSFQTYIRLTQYPLHYPLTWIAIYCTARCINDDGSDASPYLLPEASSWAHGMTQYPLLSLIWSAVHPYSNSDQHEGSCVFSSSSMFNMCEMMNGDFLRKNSSCMDRCLVSVFGASAPYVVAQVGGKRDPSNSFFVTDVICFWGLLNFLGLYHSSCLRRGRTRISLWIDCFLY